MMIVCKHFADPTISHQLHRDTIGEAIRLVEAAFVEVKPLKHSAAAKRRDLDAGIFQKLAGECGGRRTDVWTEARLVIQQFREHLIGGQQHSRPQGFRNRPYSVVPFISRIEQGNPIERIGEHHPHVYRSRFGVP